MGIHRFASWEELVDVSDGVMVTTQTLDCENPPPVSIESVCRQMQVLDAARASIANENRTVDIGEGVAVG